MGVFIRGYRGVSTAEVYVKLQPYRDELTKRLGVDTDSQFLFVSRHFADTTNYANWDELTDWLHRTVSFYETTLREIVNPCSELK